MAARVVTKSPLHVLHCANVTICTIVFTMNFITQYTYALNGALRQKDAVVTFLLSKSGVAMATLAAAVLMSAWLLPTANQSIYAILMLSTQTDI